MIRLVQKLHARLGDFWWYSLMIFVACRAADLLNAFVGLWLVPTYVSPDELGAVMPLAQFATFLALPVTIFAATFRNELTTLAVNGKFGQMKTLMRGVFIATGVALLLALVASHLLMPLFLERVRIVGGSLGFLILLSSFLGSFSPIFQNAIQSLKKFRGFSLINLLGAPIRLIVMVLAMPFRALSGYFVGQASTPAFQILAALFCLRKDLAVPAEPYWTREVVRRIGRLLALIAIGALASGFSTLVENTVLRQRLPSIDSAGYYMVTRFSEISGFLAISLIFTLFPYAAEQHARGKDMRPLIWKVNGVLIAFNGLLALFFALFGRQILVLLPHGEAYSAYAWAIPWMIAISTLNYLLSAYTTGEVAANRFGFYWWLIPLTLLYPLALLAVTGHGYYAAHLPASVLSFIQSINVTTLPSMLWWMMAIGLAKFACVLIAMHRDHPHPADA